MNDDENIIEEDNNGDDDEEEENINYCIECDKSLDSLKQFRRYLEYSKARNKKSWNHSEELYGQILQKKQKKKKAMTATKRKNREKGKDSEVSKKE